MPFRGAWVPYRCLVYFSSTSWRVSRGLVGVRGALVLAHPLASMKFGAVRDHPHPGSFGCAGTFPSQAFSLLDWLSWYIFRCLSLSIYSRRKDDATTHTADYMTVVSFHLARALCGTHLCFTGNGRRPSLGPVALICLEFRYALVPSSE